MFNSAIIRRPGLVNGSYDLGRVLETLLYYQHVHLVLDLQSVSGLVAAMGMGGLKDLLDLDHVTADLTAPEMPGVHTQLRGLESHQPVYMRFNGRRPRRDRERSEAIHEFLSRQPIASGLQLSEVRNALARAKPTTYTKLIGSETTTNSLFESIAQDQMTIRLVIAHMANRYGLSLKPGALESYVHSLSKVSDGFIVGAPGWEALFGFGRGHPELTWGSVLSWVFEYSLDLQLAANFSTDVIIDDEASELAVARIDLAIKRASKSASQISCFQELAFDNAKYFSGAVNDGQISIRKALELVARSRDLRKWVGALAPTADLAQEYVSEIGAQANIEKLGPSTLRFFSFTGAGLALDLSGAGGVGTVAGIALSAFDHFLVGRLAGGWRPNTFVNRLKSGVG